MTDILDRFIKNAKENIKAGYYGEYVKGDFPTRSLKNVLEANEFSLIAEVKHSSPAGDYSSGEMDVKKLAERYREGGARAISVVVEPRIFRGKLAHVGQAKSANLPVLFKDFIVDEKQIRAAAEIGSDSVLLIMGLIDRIGEDVDSYIDCAKGYGLETVLEVFNMDEMERAVKTDADIIGINNRDLTTLKVDLQTTRKLMEGVGEFNKPVISESGIRNGEDASFVKTLGVSGILVGTALWTCDDLMGKLKELTNAKMSEF